MICIFCNNKLIKTGVYIAICKKHPVMVTFSHKNDLLDKNLYWYNIFYLGRKFQFIFYKSIKTKELFFSVTKPFGETIINLDYHPAVSPEQALNKLKTWLLFK